MLVNIEILQRSKCAMGATDGSQQYLEKKTGTLSSSHKLRGPEDRGRRESLAARRFDAPATALRMKAGLCVVLHHDNVRRVSCHRTRGPAPAYTY